MKIKLSSCCEMIMKKLIASGYEAYLVGGAVRDYLANEEPYDYDIVTSASLVVVGDLFSDCKLVKYKKGKTIAVIYKHECCEVSSFIGNSIYEDLKVRDFSVNSLAYDGENIIDPYNGQIDIKNKILRTVSNSDEILSADPARIFRAIRFSATKGYKVSNELYESMLKNKELLLNINKERLQNDFSQILLTKKPSLYFNKYFDIFSVIIPQFKNCYNFDQHSKWHHLNVFDHIMAVLDNTKQDIVLRLAALFHDIEKPRCFSLDDNNVGHFYNHFIYSSQAAEEILLEFKYNKKIVDRVSHLIYYHDRPTEAKAKAISRLINVFGVNDLDLFFDLKRADVYGQNPEMLEGRIKALNELEALALAEAQNKRKFSLKQLNIKPYDLKCLGYDEAIINDTIEDIFIMVAERKLKNNHEKLIEFATNLKKEK